MKTLATISNKRIFLELCFGLLEINSLSITFHRTQALFSGSGVESFPFSCYSGQFSSVTQSCLILCDPMNCSRPGFPVHHQLLELAQTYVHRVGDAIQPSHPLSSLSPPAFNLHTEYIMRNARLDKSQAGIKTAGRNINNLRYADDTTLNGRK